MLNLLCTEAFCGIKLVKHEQYKDGGTECIKYNNNNELYYVCIDRREIKGTGQIYVGGHPDTKNSRVITDKEIRDVIRDIDVIMSGEEYKKYTAPNMSYENTKELLRSPDKQKRREFFKAMSYRSLEGFKQELSKQVKKAPSNQN